jgi:hypothetical protein
MFSLARVKRVCMRCFAMCLVLVSIVHFAPLVYNSVFSELVFSMSDYCWFDQSRLSVHLWGRKLNIKWLCFCLTGWGDHQKQG